MTEQHSPGVQSLIKSFDSRLPSTGASGDNSIDISSSDILPTAQPTQESAPYNTISNAIPINNKTLTSSISEHPMTAAVSPVQRHSISTDTPLTVGSPPISAISKSSIEGQVTDGSKPNTPDLKRACEIIHYLYFYNFNIYYYSPASEQPLSSLIISKEKKTSISLESRKPLQERFSPSSCHTTSLASTSGCASPVSIPDVSTSITPSVVPNKHRPLTSTVSNSLTALARRYGGSKRNALLKWCQEKTQVSNKFNFTS